MPTVLNSINLIHFFALSNLQQQKNLENDVSEILQDVAGIAGAPELIVPGQCKFLVVKEIFNALGIVQSHKVINLEQSRLLVEWNSPSRAMKAVFRTGPRVIVHSLAEAGAP